MAVLALAGITGMYVLPSIAHTGDVYVNSVIAAANNGQATGDIGLMRTAILFTGVTYVGGGFAFAIALFSANVLARWTSALLACGTLATIAVGLVPQYERLFALPTGLAFVALGYSYGATSAPRLLRRSLAMPVSHLGAVGAN